MASPRETLVVRRLSSADVTAMESHRVMLNGVIHTDKYETRQFGNFDDLTDFLLMRGAEMFCGTCKNIEGNFYFNGNTSILFTPINTARAAHMITPSEATHVTFTKKTRSTWVLYAE
jgi:hypothetical protein